MKKLLVPLIAILLVCGFVSAQNYAFVTINGFTPAGIACSGTLALGTTLITSASKTALTMSCTGLASTDVISASFNADPTATTGYVPATAGMLTIVAWPTANTVNVDVINNTASSITPGASLTINVIGLHRP